MKISDPRHGVIVSEAPVRFRPAGALRRVVERSMHFSDLRKSVLSVSPVPACRGSALGFSATPARQSPGSLRFLRFLLLGFDLETAQTLPLCVQSCMHFPGFNPNAKPAQESFRSGNGNAGFALLNFWQWTASDLVSNSTRGVLAEFLVARALGLDTGVRVDGFLLG